MKLAVFTDVGQIVFEEHPKPVPSAEQVLVKVQTCALCTWEQRVYTGAKRIRFPFVGGHEVAGVIEQLGAKVNADRWHIGQKVVVGLITACNECTTCKEGNAQSCPNLSQSLPHDGLPYPGIGGLSEYMLVNTINLFPYDKVTPEEAALIEPLSCVLQSVERADIHLGDTVVVVGCGIMGQLHIRLAKLRGARVIVSDPKQERLDFAIRMGADHAVDPRQASLAQTVMDITNGRGAQVVFDTTPIAELVLPALECLSTMGKLMLYSSFYPDKPVAISPDMIHKKTLSIMGAANSGAKDFVVASRLISNGIIDVKPFISRVFPFDELDDALKLAAGGEQYRVVVKMDP